MIPDLRRRFNAQFRPERYQRLLRFLEERSGVPIGFRNCETPCFFERALLEKMADYGRELVAQVINNTEYLAAARARIPERFRTPGETPHPLFVQADFGLDEQGEPRLVEIQGFPSLYAYQPLLVEAYRTAYALDDGLTPFFHGLDVETYTAMVRDAIVGPHDPENVVLLEIEPETQKTLPDFVLTERLYGIRTVCLTQVQKQGRSLFYRRDGHLTRIERIYNRVIPDELERRGITSGFDFRDELDVEWADHPCWFFLLSKYALPFFHHPCVPETRFLDQVDPLPDDLEQYVLKPLFSFAGQGVRIGPVREEIDAIADPSHYVLQRRIHFRPVIETPHGPTRVEVRIMYLWPRREDDEVRIEDLRPLTTLLRMGRGQMMGVDHNRDLEWVGASVAFLV
ncbi:MAG: hypothetical protein RMJ43_16220 [Chloroherpetonaceae bacterium]|nr:hypothetical protein [Chthonomonadaceae bacterium]MDW8209379.1 hypothetical protein [Chloroherpetonaceae bacterium]